LTQVFRVVVARCGADVLDHRINLLVDIRKLQTIQINHIHGLVNAFSSFNRAGWITPIHILLHFAQVVSSAAFLSGNGPQLLNVEHSEPLDIDWPAQLISAMVGARVHSIDLRVFVVNPIEVDLINLLILSPF